jgi:hypothetical protein
LGKFQGVMAETTPTPCLITTTRELVVAPAMVSP